MNKGKKKKMKLVRKIDERKTNVKKNKIFCFGKTTD